MQSHLVSLLNEGNQSLKAKCLFHCFLRERCFDNEVTFSNTPLFLHQTLAIKKRHLKVNQVLVESTSSHIQDNKYYYSWQIFLPYQHFLTLPFLITWVEHSIEKITDENSDKNCVGLWTNWCILCIYKYRVQRGRTSCKSKNVSITATVIYRFYI